MHIPESIMVSMKKGPLDNNYFYSAESMISRLKLVHDGTIDLIPSDLATLVNATEMLYKGLIEAKADDSIKTDRIMHTHNLVNLCDLIEEKIIKLAPNLSKDEQKARKRFMYELSDAYFDTRYNNEQVLKEDFDKCFLWMMNQKNLIYEYLEPSVMKTVSFDKEEMDLGQNEITLE